MKFTFSKDYLNQIKDSDDVTREINPSNCSKDDFRSLIAYVAITCNEEISGLKQEVSQLRAENVNLKSRISSLESSLNNVVEDNLSLTQDMINCKAKIAQEEESNQQLALRIKVLEDFRFQSVKSSEGESERILNLERHSRKRNLRFILQQPERENENTTEILSAELQKLGINARIEHSHRTGKKIDGKPRQIIACFCYRPEMYDLLSKKSVLYSNNIKVFEDLCHTDYVEKKKHSDYMSRLYAEGKRVRFSRGCWYINDVKFSGREGDVPA